MGSWNQVRRDVKMTNSRIAALLSSVDPLDVRDQEIVLVSPYEFHRNKLNDDAVRRVVEDVLARHMGAHYQVVCVAPDEVPPAPSSASTVAPAVVASVSDAPAIPEPAAPPPPDPAPGPDAAAAPSPALEPEDADSGVAEDEEQRLRAARAIFNAEEIEPE